MVFSYSITFLHFIVALEASSTSTMKYDMTVNKCTSELATPGRSLGISAQLTNKNTTVLLYMTEMGLT